MEKRTYAAVTAQHYPHTTAGRKAALARRWEAGGWVIDHGDCLWHTDDQGTAEDLVLPLVGEDRLLAERAVRHSALQGAKAPVVTHEVARKVAAAWRCVGVCPFDQDGCPAGVCPHRDMRPIDVKL